MKHTYAVSGLLIGFLFGMLIWVKTQNTTWAVAAAIGSGALCFFLIRGVESVINRNADRAAERIAATIMDFQHKNYML